jgi:predicted thioesterase
MRMLFCGYLNFSVVTVAYSRRYPHIAQTFVGYTVRIGAVAGLRT